MVNSRTAFEVFQLGLNEIRREQAKLDIRVCTLGRKTRFDIDATNICEQIAGMKIFPSRFLLPSVQSYRYSVRDHTAKPFMSISLDYVRRWSAVMVTEVNLAASSFCAAGVHDIKACRKGLPITNVANVKEAIHKKQGPSGSQHRPHGIREGVVTLTG